MFSNVILIDSYFLLYHASPISFSSTRMLLLTSTSLAKAFQKTLCLSYRKRLTITKTQTYKRIKKSLNKDISVGLFCFIFYCCSRATDAKFLIITIGVIWLSLPNGLLIKIRAIRFGSRPRLWPSTADRFKSFTSATTAP